MNITQTSFFHEDVKHYTQLAKDYMYTTRKEEIRNGIKRLTSLRGADYVKKLSAKCNQCLKVKFY